MLFKFVYFFFGFSCCCSCFCWVAYVVAQSHTKQTVNLGELNGCLICWIKYEIIVCIELFLPFVKFHPKVSEWIWNGCDRLKRLTSKQQQQNTDRQQSWFISSAQLKKRTIQWKQKVVNEEIKRKRRRKHFLCVIFTLQSRVCTERSDEFMYQKEENEKTNVRK